MRVPLGEWFFHMKILNVDTMSYARYIPLVCILVVTYVLRFRALPPLPIHRMCWT